MISGETSNRLHNNYQYKRFYPECRNTPKRVSERKKEKNAIFTIASVFSCAHCRFERARLGVCVKRPGRTVTVADTRATALVKSGARVCGQRCAAVVHVHFVRALLTVVKRYQAHKGEHA